MANEDQRPRCDNCGKPTSTGLRIGDGPGVPMCVDCQQIMAQTEHARQQTKLAIQERFMRESNYLTDQMESSVGLRGVLPRYHLPERAPVNNHIRIENSQIGVVNTGVIHHIDSAIGHLESSGDGQLAVAFKQITEAVANASDVDQEKKAEILEGLSALSEEAAKPKAQRRLALMKSILENVKLAAETIQSVAPIMINAWPHIVAALV